MRKRQGLGGCFATPKRYCPATRSDGDAPLAGRVANKVAKQVAEKRTTQLAGELASKGLSTKTSGFRDIMPQKVRIALDAMGGDVGASVVVPGAAIALARHPDSEFLLFGKSELIEAELANHSKLKAASRVIHTDVAVSSEDKPSQALRRGRKTSSMW